MDANRETVHVKIAGRDVAMLKPTQDQLVGLTMVNSPHLPEGAKISALTNMFLVLLPTDEDREWFLSQMVGGNYSLEDLTKTLTAIATAKTAVAVTPRKTTARKRA
jgi:hypothetical protein